ncbi:MAG: M14 family zinc carboxypeptidase [Acidobacteriota bacterium]
MKGTALSPRYLLLAIALPSAAAASTPFDVWQPRALWDAWENARFVEVEAPCVTPSVLTEEVERLRTTYPEQVRVRLLGESVEGRAIRLLRLGTGSRRVLLWSQMHGDEASATPALLDLAHALLSSSSEASRQILSELELLMVPMLNPDGAERWTRRNAYDVDLNRDALHLATPEARLLKELRDETEPILGFNLHDQGRRILAGETGELATLSLLGVAGDPEGTLTPERERAMRAASAMVDAARWRLGEAIGRYDEDWNPRAFGDNITRWGTPVVLLESGGIRPERPISELTRLNFIVLAHSLAALARNDLGDYSVDAYRALPRNKRNGFSDLVVRGGDLWHPGSATRFRGDLAIDIVRADHDAEECVERIAGRSRTRRSSVVEVGDGSQRVSGRDFDATDQVVFGALTVRWEGSKDQNSVDRSLRALAQLGVGSVLWQVPEDEAAKALEIARELQRPGLPRLSVTAEEVERGLRWTGSSPEGRTLGGLANAFGVSMDDLLAETSAFRRGVPGSFFTVRSPGSEAPGADAPIEAVFLDGTSVDP